MSYAITEYPDTGEIYRKLDALLAMPTVRLRREAMEAALETLDTRCAKSKAMITEAKQYIPGVCSTIYRLIIPSAGDRTRRGPVPV